ncbi:MAG TPA: hypothetical protein PLL20_16895 [Phycisphaerae bacterium]|nr:hypothetical protein [Phycisphaerae bacterium]HRR85142.1 hypothetical protein [Phycisphaerae bacterium]
MPRIAGPWWTVARSPDLGGLNGPPAENPNHRQEPVDFAIWQAADGTWQIWSCIRNTRCGGLTRLFYRWEGKRLTDPDWTPLGIAMQADPKYESRVGGLQAPYVIRIGDLYYMIYGDWDWLMIQRSRDGKVFERWPYPNGKLGMFTEGPEANTRDPMLIRINDLWHCYYTAFPNQIGAVFCRTSKDLRTWSESKVVARGGLTGTSPYSCECPHVVKIGDWFYLFRTQRYAGPPTTSVYRSKDPMDFGIDEKADDKFVCLLEVAAPEIVFHGNLYYIAALLPDIQGIRIARLTWIPDSMNRGGSTTN